MRRFIIFISFCLLLSCNTKTPYKVDVSKINIQLNINRFEQEFYTSNTGNLAELKAKYPLLFPKQHDSVWLNKINNKDEQELFKASQKLYTDFSKQEQQLTDLFKYIKYYHNDFRIPKVTTILTNMDSRVIYADTLLFISLDNFLGKKHSFYDDYPNYIKENNTQEHLIVDVAMAIINKQAPPNFKRQFIDKIIYEGKKMYLLDLYLPEISDALKIGYSNHKMAWIKENEEQVWRYFIDKGYLYSSDLKLSKRFIDPAPFSKFYLEGDNKSPGQVGIYIGWQIVRSFMKHHKISLNKLMTTKEDVIFKGSKYRPGS